MAAHIPHHKIVNRLNDDLVGRVLDRLFETGTQKIFTGVARRAVVAYGIEDRVLHVDTASNVMYGDHEFAETAPPPLRTRKRSASSGTR